MTGAVTDKKRILSLAEPVLEGNEARYLQDCVVTNFVSSVGPFVSQFETSVAQSAGAERCVSVSSGTTALHLALTVMGVMRDDLVIVPSYTFIASANAISHCGAMPWLFDIGSHDWALDPVLLRVTLESETTRTAAGLIHTQTGRRVSAILPVYTLGVPVDIDAIMAVADDFALPVIADAAAAHGATYKGRPLGQFGPKLSVLSFNGNKTVTAGAGGCIVGNDEKLMARVFHLATTARVGRNYDHDQVGFNYRLSNLNAAVGLAQMERFADLAAAKRRIRQTYDRAFADLDDVMPFPRPEWAQDNCWLSGFLARKESAHLKQELAAVGVEIREFWKPMHLQAPYLQAPRTSMQVSDSIWRRVKILPSSSNLSPADQSRVIDAVRRAFA